MSKLLINLEQRGVIGIHRAVVAKVADIPEYWHENITRLTLNGSRTHICKKSRRVGYSNGTNRREKPHLVGKPADSLLQYLS